MKEVEGLVEEVEVEVEEWNGSGYGGWKKRDVVEGVAYNRWLTRYGVDLVCFR